LVPYNIIGRIDQECADNLEKFQISSMSSLARQFVISWLK
jgi:hypothetical protein